MTHKWKKWAGKKEGVRPFLFSKVVGNSALLFVYSEKEKKKLTRASRQKEKGVRKKKKNAKFDLFLAGKYGKLRNLWRLPHCHCGIDKPQDRKFRPEKNPFVSPYPVRWHISQGSGSGGADSFMGPPEPKPTEKWKQKHLGRAPAQALFLYGKSEEEWKWKIIKELGELRAVVKVRGRPPLILLSFENVCQRYYRRRRSRNGNWNVNRSFIGESVCGRDPFPPF